VPSFTLGGDTSGEPPLETLTRVPTYNEPGAAVRSDNALQVETLDNRPARQPRSVTGTSPSGLEPTETFRSSNDEEPAANEVSPVAAIPAGPADPVQLQAEYQQAFNLLRQSQYDSAIRAFQEFLAIHPNDRYSDNAQYWLAEAYYVKRDFAQALNEYNNVVENFPQSQKVNDALLKTGFTLHELGRLDEARSRLQELMEKQPGTTIARLADERLKLINSANPNTPPASN
jgi:tol-pal system protein YbgF